MTTSQPGATTDPRSGDAMKRGIAAAHARNAVEAVHWFRQAVADAPDDTNALAWLGQSLCAIGERLEGTRQLQVAGAAMVAREFPAKLNNVIQIIVQLQQWKEVEGALALCQQAALAAPRDPRLQQMLAVCLGQLNQPGAALAACIKAREFGMADPMLHVLQASLEADNRQFELARDHLKAVLLQKLAPVHIFRANKELARAEDALGHADAAFAALDAASRAAKDVPEFKRFDLGHLPAMISENRATFEPAVLDRWSRQSFSNDHAPPVFLIGFYRSGTTLTQSVLDAHPDIFVADEANLLNEVQHALKRLRPEASSLAHRLSSLQAEDIQSLRDLYWKRARGSFGAGADSKVFIDKFTLNTVDVGLINVIFPDAKIIFMVRDPRDVCLSCFMQLMVPTLATVHLLDWNTTAQFYRTVMDWWMDVRAKLTLQWIEVRYEDAVGDFDATYKRILHLLGLEWHADMRRFHERASRKFISSPSRNQVAQPLYATSLARWTKYRQHFAPIAAHLAPVIRAFEYPEN